MPSKIPSISLEAQAQLKALGERLRERRKQMRISATAASEAAGVSRPTLYRIEEGHASVTVGALVATATAVGMKLQWVDRIAPAAAPAARSGWIPSKIRLSEYPKLRELAWHVQGTDELRPREALSIYENHREGIDPAELQAQERDLLAALREGLGTDGI